MFFSKAKNFLKKYWYSFFICLIILFGILLRAKGFLLNPSMWRDECALGWNIKFKSYLELFGPLRFDQMAPPLFLVAVKFVVNLFGVQNIQGVCDLAMRTIPFVCGILSIGVFYFVSKEVFQSRKAVIWAVLFFVVNKVLIDYSFEIKPYESDMFFTLLLILFFVKLNLSSQSYKKITAEALGLSLVIWFSFVSVFAIGAGFVNLILKRKDYKKIILLFSPVFLSGLFYLRFYVGSNNATAKIMAEFWSKEFILPNFSNFLYLLVENIRYFFFPAAGVLFVLILLLWGSVVYIKKQDFEEKNRDFITVALSIFVFLITASALRFYPFSNRLIIFLIPIFILIILKPFDKIKGPFKALFILIMTALIFIPQFQYTVENLKIQTFNKGEFPREMMDYISKNVKKEDTIFLNNASRAEFEYYSSFYEIKNKIVYESLGNTPGKEYSELLNGLPKGNYWLFLPYDYSPRGVIIKYVKNWAESNTKVIYVIQATQSVLMYVSVP